MMEHYDQLKELYFNQHFPGSLGGQNRFYKAAKEEIPGLKKSDVVKFLLTQTAYQLHAPARIHFKRSKIFVRGPSQV